MSSSQLYERLKNVTMIDTEALTSQEKNILEAQLLEFQVFKKKANMLLTKMKVETASHLTSKQTLIKSYGGMAQQLAQYEETNLVYYVDNDSQRLVVNNMDQGNLIESLRHTVENSRNPFTDLYHWIKGEIYDLAAFEAALLQLKAQATAVETLTKKIQSTKTDIENLTAGKKSVNTLFKSSNDVHTLQNKLEGYEVERVNSEKLHVLMLVYLGKRVLPSFKTEKLRLYRNIVQQFHVVEINNNHQ